MSRLDDLEKTLIGFDWISPLLAGIRDLKEGPNVTIFMPENAPGARDSKAVGNVLRDFYGIESWGYMFINGYFMLTIHKRNAEKAAWALNREGIPYEVPE
jgi:hypothetical protein